MQSENEMQNEDNPEYSITIEYDDFLTRFDLDEILSSIDRIIEDELIFELDPEFRLFSQRRYGYPYLFREAPELSYVGITAVDRGSIILTVLATGAVATYVAKRFKKGVDKSLLAEQLERSGRLAGDVFGSVLERINDWAEKYVPKQRDLGGKVKTIRVERKPKPEPKKKLKP
jgi:hypothetical protein